MKKQELSQTNKKQEIYAFTNNGITVFVGINYERNKISFLENDGEGYCPKKWDFSGRGVEYMQGWLNILEVMREAIEDAKSRYEEYVEVKEKREDELMVRVLKEVNNK